VARASITPLLEEDVMEGPSQLQSESPRFTVLDSDVPFLAVKAAIELDNLKLGKTSSLTAVRSLAARLKSSGRVPTSTAADSLFDPPTIAAMRDAIAATPFGEPKTIESLATEAWQIATKLSALTPEPSSQLETLKKFCTILSERATACQYGSFSPDLPESRDD
jgi:hypothetical protein